MKSTSSKKLNLPLLKEIKSESVEDLKLLAVNFDPDLVRLLRETKYFLLLKIDQIPTQAINLYEQVYSILIESHYSIINT